MLEVLRGSAARTVSHGLPGLVVALSAEAPRRCSLPEPLFLCFHPPALQTGECPLSQRCSRLLSQSASEAASSRTEQGRSSDGQRAARTTLASRSCACCRCQLALGAHTRPLGSSSQGPGCSEDIVHDALLSSCSSFSSSRRQATSGLGPPPRHTARERAREDARQPGGHRVSSSACFADGALQPCAPLPPRAAGHGTHPVPRFAPRSRRSRGKASYVDESLFGNTKPGAAPGARSQVRSSTGRVAASHRASSAARRLTA